MPSSGVQTCALRSEEHTSELQSHDNLVCRLLLEKQHRRLAQADLADAPAEVVARRLLQAVAPVAEVDLVQVELEDLVFFLIDRDTPGQDGLAHHALVGA